MGTGQDFNSDGFDDVYWIADSGGSNVREITIWLGRADGSFVNSRQNNLFDPANVWFVQGMGDFDGNGASDLSWDTIGGLSSTRDAHLLRTTGWAQSATVYGRATLIPCP